MCGILRKPLVSIITPCYNGEKFVHRFLDSVLNQTHENIELIFVNDGSTDKTEEIVLSYEDKFKSKDIEFKYIYQENKGQAAALNQGLKIFKGEYLTWPDSDDILHEDNLMEKVRFLENHPEYGMVLCKSRKLNEDNLEQIGVLKRISSKNGKDNLFHDLIIQKNVYFAPGGYMVRSSSFIDVVPERKIYESRGGQNFQMLLPIAYKYKCGYIDKYLYDYLVRVDSHSRQTKEYESIITRCDEHEDLLNHVIKDIKDMSKKEKTYYLDLIEQKYARKRLKIAAKYANKEMIENYYEILKNNGNVTFKDKLFYLKGKYTLVNYTYSILRLLFLFLKKLKRVFL